MVVFGGDTRKEIWVEKVNYTHKPVSPIMSSEAPCIVSGVAGICLQIILFIF